MNFTILLAAMAFLQTQPSGSYDVASGLAKSLKCGMTTNQMKKVMEPAGAARVTDMRRSFAAYTWQSAPVVSGATATSCSVVVVTRDSGTGAGARVANITDRCVVKTGPDTLGQYATTTQNKMSKTCP